MEPTKMRLSLNTMRCRAIVLMTALVAMSCSGGATLDSTSTTSTSAPKPTSASTVEATDEAPRTTQEQDPTTTTTEAMAAVWDIPRAAPPAPVLVTNAAGLLLDDDLGAPLIAGRVTRGMDDLGGGVVFQMESSDYSWDATELNESRDTIIWWVPAGGDAPQELLVPSGSQWLTLHDVVEIGGSAHVVYTRLEGNSPDDRIETLRTFDLDARTVTEVARVGGWESRTGHISGGDGLFTFEWFAESFTGFAFLDGSGEDLVLEADPFQGRVCDGGLPEGPGSECYSLLDLDPSSGRIAYLVTVHDSSARITSRHVAVASLDGSTETRYEIPISDQEGWWPRSVDLFGGYMLVNGYGQDFGIASPALMIDLDTGDMVRLNVDGEARFVRIPPRTSSGVIAPDSAGRNGWPFEDVLFAGSDGISVVATDGQVVVHLVGGHVRVAVDDLRGGIVFQLGQRFTSNGRYDQIIYWLPVGDDTVVELVVAPVGNVQLHDVTEIDGRVAVLYTLDDLVVGFDNTKTLWSYDLTNGDITELGIVGGWESGTGPISAGPEMIAYEWFAEIYSGFEFLGMDGARIDAGADPYGPDEDCLDGIVFNYVTEEERPGCPSHLTIDMDGTRIAYVSHVEDGQGYLTDYQVHVVTLAGEELASIRLNRPDQGYGINGLELQGDRVIVNRTASDDWTAQQIEPLMIDILTGEVRFLAYAGYARFLVVAPNTGTGILVP